MYDRGKLGCDPEVKEAGLMGFMVDTRPPNHEAIAPFWGRLREALRSIDSPKSMAIYVQTGAFVDTHMYVHKTFIPWLLAAMTPGATIMYIDSDALVGSPGRLAELLTALASRAPVAPASVTTHDNRSPLNGGWVLWPASSRRLPPRDCTGSMWTKCSSIRQSN